MTESEVFEGIHKDCGSLEICNYKKTGCGDCPIRQTLINAEKALEEIKQYRAIGTIEDFKALKNKHIGKDNMVISSSDLMTILNSDSEELKQYKEVGTVEEFKDLKEKATPKKGIPYTSSNNHKFVECPSCHKDMDLYYDFCQYCGQSVDWGKSKT